MTDTLKECTPNGWTLEALVEHNKIVREQDKEFLKLLVTKVDGIISEHDRRYAEVNVEKEKALKIKETADLAALELARESQKYKEERNDAQREQTLGERGAYVTRNDLVTAIEGITKELKPLFVFMNNHDGKDRGSQLTAAKLVSIIGATGVIVGIIATIIANLGSV